MPAGPTAQTNCSDFTEKPLLSVDFSTFGYVPLQLACSIALLVRADAEESGGVFTAAWKEVVARLQGQHLLPGNQQQHKRRRPQAVPRGQVQAGYQEKFLS